MAARIGRGLEGRFLNLSTAELGNAKAKLDSIGKAVSPRPLKGGTFGSSATTRSGKKYSRYGPSTTEKKEPRTRCYKITKLVAIVLGLSIMVATIVLLWTKYQEPPTALNPTESVPITELHNSSTPLSIPSIVIKNDTNLDLNKTPKGSS